MICGKNFLDGVDWFSIFLPILTSLIGITDFGAVIDFGLDFSLASGSGASISIGKTSFLSNFFYDLVLFLIGVVIDSSTFTKLVGDLLIVLESPSIFL